MNIFTIGSIVLKLLPHIADAIKDIEQLDQTPGKGPAKQQVVLAIVKAAYEATTPTVPFDELQATVIKVVAALVEFYNSIGLFHKKTA